MSQSEIKSGFFPELWDALRNPEQRLAQTFEGAKELVERHPRLALVAAIGGGLFLYEEYTHNYEKRTGQKLDGPFALIRDVATRLEDSPEGLIQEAHTVLDSVGTFVRQHKVLTIGIAIVGPFLLERIARRFEPKAMASPGPTSGRRVR